MKKCFVNVVLEPFENFWKMNPALLYGFAMLLGVGLFVTKEWVLLLPLSLVLLARKRTVAALILVAASYFFIAAKTPSDFENQEHGIAYFKIASISLKSSHFGKQWIYKGWVRSLKSDQNVPVSIALPFKHGILRPLANKAYYVKGTLKEVSKRRYSFVLEKNAPWQEVPGSWSFAELRFNLKQKIQQIIRNKIKNEESAKFLSGIATGEFDDRLMSFHFSRFGLQHIMSISGFHFAILSAILHTLLQCFLSRKNAALAMISLLTGYFIFLGMAPSILRAYVMIIIVFVGYLLEKESFALNSLGIALIAVLFADTFLIDQIGFQFSFIVTLSILLFFSSIDLFLTNLLPRRYLSDVAEMHFLEQHGFIILNFLRQSTSLCLAVNMAAFPLMIFHFETFPLLSILYNFFFPFMVSFSMLLLILGLIFPFIPLIDTLNTAFTKFLLDFAYNMPQTIDYKFFYKNLSFEWVIVYFTILFLIGVNLQFRKEKMAEERRDFAYL